MKNIITKPTACRLPVSGFFIDNMIWHRQKLTPHATHDTLSALQRGEASQSEAGVSFCNPALFIMRT